MIGPAPSLRLDLNVGTSWSLPSWSSGPHGDEQATLEASRAAGYWGVQCANPRRCRDLGLIPSTFGIHASPGGLLEQVRSWADNGFACCTQLLGTGMEDDDGAARLVDEVLHASATAGIPMYVETHRAALTQDAWRTVRLVDRFPELRFNGDFSHWYAGLDLSFGNFEAKLDFLAPVFDRVRYSTAGSGHRVASRSTSAMEEPTTSRPSPTSVRCGHGPRLASWPTSKTTLSSLPTSSWALHPSCCPPRSSTHASSPAPMASPRRWAIAGPKPSCSPASPSTALPRRAATRTPWAVGRWVPVGGDQT